MTFSIMTLSIKGLFVTLSINVNQHNNTLYRVPLCYYYAECRNLFIVMLNVIVLCAVMLNVIMLSVMAPTLRFDS
jgi:hypothetical protein